MKTFCLSPSWRHDIRPNDTKHYDTYHDDTKHNESGYNETQHGNGNVTQPKDTQHNNKKLQHSA